MSHWRDKIIAETRTLIEPEVAQALVSKALAQLEYIVMHGTATERVAAADAILRALSVTPNLPEAEDDSLDD